MSDNAKIRILYIEDEPVLCDLFKASVSSYGYFVDVAHSGKIGLALHAKLPFDVVVVDFQLPEMTGIDIARHLLADNPNLPILMVTGHGDQRLAVEALTLGVANYVVKDDSNVYLELIPSIISHLLERTSRRRDQLETEQALINSERKFRNLFNNSAAGIGRSRLSDGKVLMANKKLAEMYGYDSQEEFVEEFVFSEHWVYPEKRTRLIDILNADQDYTEEIVHTKRDGSIIHVQSTHWLDKETGHIDFVDIDISQRKLVEEQLIKTLNILNETSSIAKVGGWELDVASGQLTWTDETFRILEVEKREGQQPVLPEGLDLFTPESKPIIEEAVHRAIEFGEPYSLELEALTAKGNVVWVYTNGKANYEDGKVVTLSGTIQDINYRKLAEINHEYERKISEAMLIEAKSDAEAASKSKSEFLANMSHELRTPLNAIIGFSQIWTDEVFGVLENTKYMEYAKDINRAGTHLLEIVSEILDISKIEAGEMGLEIESVELGDTVSSCLSLLSVKAEASQINLTHSISHQSGTMAADKRMLKQILINVVGNAIKFTPKGGDVDVLVNEDDVGNTQIEVTDSGIGIPENAIHMVLEPFGQIRDSSHVAHEGTGLGLPIAKRMVELHGGTLSVRSEVHKGTTVLISLPTNDDFNLAL